MRIVVHMLLNAEGLACHFQLNAQLHVQILGLFSGFGVIFASNVETRLVGVLYVFALIAAVKLHINAFLHKRLVAVFQQVIFALEIHHGASLALEVYHEQRRYAGSFGHLGVVGTESRSNMHNACAVVYGYVIALDDTEGQVSGFHEIVVTHREAFVWVSGGIPFYLFRAVVVNLEERFHPRHQLLITHAGKLSTLP